MKLVKGINQKLAEADETSLSESRLTTTFQKYWPDLEAALKPHEREPAASKGVKAVRTERDLLEEILELLRNQQRESTSLTIREALIPNLVGASEFKPVAEARLPHNVLASFNSPTIAAQAQELLASLEHFRSLGSELRNRSAILEIPKQAKEALAVLERFNRSLASEAAKSAEELSKSDIRKIAENLQPDVKAVDSPAISPPKDPKEKP